MISIFCNVNHQLFQWAVPVNAFVLAITSEFIPRVVYKHERSNDHSLKGYVNYSLSYFHVKDFNDNERPDVPKATVSYTKSVCR